MGRYLRLAACMVFVSSVLCSGVQGTKAGEGIPVGGIDLAVVYDETTDSARLKAYPSSDRVVVVEMRFLDAQGTEIGTQQVSGPGDIMTITDIRQNGLTDVMAVGLDSQGHEIETSGQVRLETAPVATAALSVSTAANSAQSVAGDVFDVVFLMDGSGSISAEDFSLQKDGLINAISNSAVVPRDGSIAIAVVQFGNGITRVESPYRVIQSEADASSVIATIRAFGQIGGSTNPGDAVNQAVTVLNNSGTPGATQVICMSTDGTPNDGADLPAALNTAKSSAIGVEKFTVIAMEDPGFLTEAELQAYYAPLVFGGGVVNVARNATEFANIVGAAIFPPNLRLVALEVNQVVQNWHNSVRLVAGKKTYVRAFIETVSGDSAEARARLHGFRSGSELPGSPITAINSGGTVTVTDAAAPRGDFDSSLNFRLPHAWTSGQITLQLEAVGGGMQFYDAALPDVNDGATTVEFENVPEMKVYFTGVPWIEWLGGLSFEYHRPTLAQLVEESQRLYSSYPVSSLQYKAGILLVPEGLPDLDAINTRLNRARILSLTTRDYLYYGVLTGTPPGTGLGLADGIPGNVASGFIADTTDDWSAMRSICAHELGHVMGRPHAAYRQTTYTFPDGTMTQLKIGSCRDYSDLSAPDFPYVYKISLDAFTEVNLPTLGPMDEGANAMVFGLDTHGEKIADPCRTWEMMSYCGLDHEGVGGREGWQWCSDWTYESLMDAVIDRWGSGSSSPTASLSAGANYILVQGTINLNTNSLDLLPLVTLYNLSNPPEMPTGVYSLAAYGSSGQLVGQIPFAPPTPVIEDTNDPPLGSFAVFVPKSWDASRIAIFHGDTEIGSVSASSSAPEVTVVSPNGGETLAADSVLIEWNGQDDDGDALTYTVLYSANGGGTWDTLAVDATDPNITVDTGWLAGTTQGVIRVIASDGFNSGQDDSDGFFTVGNKAPEVILQSPAENQMFTGVQQVFFEAMAYDIEDGPLSGANLVWRSDVDGVLGTGEKTNLEATDLTEGSHLITVEATDSNGASTTRATTVLVYRLAPLNQPPVAEAGPNQVAFAGMNDLAEVTLDGSGSYDPDGDELTYQWTWEIGSQAFDVNGVNPTIELPAGQHVVSLTVHDGTVVSDANTMIVDVTSPIICELRMLPRYIVPKPWRNATVFGVIRLPANLQAADISDAACIILPTGTESLWQRLYGRRRLQYWTVFELPPEVFDPGVPEIRVGGRLNSGRWFYGSDHIRVGNGPRRYRAAGE